MGLQLTIFLCWGEQMAKKIVEKNMYFKCSYGLASAAATRPPIRIRTRTVHAFQLNVVYSG